MHDLQAKDVVLGPSTLKQYKHYEDVAVIKVVEQENVIYLAKVVAVAALVFDVVPDGKNEAIVGITAQCFGG